MTQGTHATLVSSTDPALRALLRDVARPWARTPPPALVAGRYHIGEALGSGGMGTVYRAVDERLGRQVALKWMHFQEHDGVSDEAFARFVREARAAALVRHPNVVQVLDVSDEPSTPFIVMELLEGESLRARIARGTLPWTLAIPIVERVLDGLAALHVAGVVHRDIKPSNIFLIPSSDSEPGVKVLDLGVAYITEAEGLGGLTGTGTQLGTPAYMPLEQLRGERVDFAADLYAVGVVLYEMLAGVRPFAARTAADLAVQIATSRAPELGAVHGVSAHQNSVLQRALSREATQRFGSAMEFKTALRGKSRSSRSSLRYVALVLVAALIGVGVVVASASWREPVESARTTGAHVDEPGPPPPEAPPLEASIEESGASTDNAQVAAGTDPPNRNAGPNTSTARRRHPVVRATPAEPPAEIEAPQDAHQPSPALRISEFDRRQPIPAPTLSAGEF